MGGNPSGCFSVGESGGVQMAGMNFQTRPSTTANKVVSFYGVTDRHNDSFLCD
uniref:DUF6783 domain-containing protein n=1 Tax=Enterocloster aldenensis TaxID=358742 RepID=UPI003519BC3A